MKNLLQLAIAATLAIGATANSHQHLHRHVKKQAGSKAEKRGAGPVIHYVAGTTETKYVLNGKELDAKDAVAGLKDGEYVIVGETTPNFSPPCPPPPPPPPPPKPKTPSAKNLGAQFLEKPPNAPPPAPTSTHTPTSPPPPPPKSPPAAKPNAHSGGTGGTGGTGLNSKFPSGKIPCQHFPYEYGAVPLPWLNYGGWSGLQYVPDFLMETSEIINKIITGVAGDSCSPGKTCSYSCPDGYQKTQWPIAQGSLGESVGGLHCNSDGYLELTREECPTLCERGAGGVTIRNDLNEVVSTCRTDYPGTESMVLPVVAQPGGSVEVANPEQVKSYKWKGKKTSAQYYINKKGLGPSQACVWNCPNDPKGCGNWAPANLGVSQDEDGITYISIFQNFPTSTATLDFNIKITGDVNKQCAYKDGNWYSDGKLVGATGGCTTAMQKGGKAVIRYY
ncbi:hypothetical protein EsDP_00006485 [Epichloe bromicola]|uniref:Uncharacterized protein n=1 Tax=Epichloe bromicola TaxID=79588 RepID=A0ABQ0CY09_9HYPO